MAATSCPASSSSTATATATTSAVNTKAALASAAGTNQPHKHRPTSLRTPLTGTYPSTIQSPSISFSSFHNIPPTPVSSVPDHNHLKASDIPPSSATSFGARTPLTPPPAYLDFLKAVSPSILPSPLSTGTSVHFSFSATSTKSPGLPVPHSANLSGKWTGREKWPRTHSGPSAASAYPPRHGRSASLSQRPVLSSHASQESTVSSVGSTGSSESMESMESDLSTESATPSSKGTFERPAAISGGQARSASDSHISAVMSTVAHSDQRTSSDTIVSNPASIKASGPLRRPSIIIPPSPSTSIPIPVSASALRSASSLRDCAMFSADTTPTGTNSPLKTPRTVSVRQVVTKTVTYNRPHLQSKGAIESQSSRGPRESDDSTRPVVKEVDVIVKTEHDRTDDEEQSSRQGTPKPLVGEAPRGKRRKVD